MIEKKYSGAPFGTQTARFDVSGIHPKSKPPGTLVQVAHTGTSSALGPGSYDPDVGCFTVKAVSEAAMGPGWARAHETERLAQMPHLLHREDWQNKRELVRKLGPGSYEIKDSITLQQEKPRSSLGVCATRDSRFKDIQVQHVTPGPGTYGHGGIPHSALEIKQRQSAGNRGLLDNGAPDLRAVKQTGSHLAPGTYSFESSTDQLNKRKVSERGPYDLFSEDRNDGIKAGHFAKPKLANLGPGQYNFRSFTDDLSRHRYTGRISRLPQHPSKHSERIFLFSMAHRAPDDLAPGQYNPKQVERPLQQGQGLPPFLSSAVRVDKMATKFFTGNFNSVGAGRYDFKRYEDAQIHRDGHTNNFKSNTGRLKLTQVQALGERLRAKDVPVSERVFLVDPVNPSKHLRRTQTNMDKSMAPVRESRRAATMVC